MNDLKGVKIGFFGTPDFALKFLNYLYENNAEISFIVTQPASVSGRGKKINPSPVQKWGLEKNLKVYSPTKVNDPNFRKNIKEENVDFIIIVAYGNLIDDFIINKVWLFDNARSHIAKSVLESIKNSGNDYVLNIPYHPQTNPIESYFSELKHYIKLDSKIEYNDLLKSIKKSMENLLKNGLKNL